MHVFIDTNILLNFFHFSKDELDALNNVFASHEHGAATVHLTEQVCDEFKRNRENKIKDALRRFKEVKYSPQLPSFMKSYEEFGAIKKLSAELQNLSDVILAKVEKDVVSRSLVADSLINEIIDKSEILETTEAIYRKAKMRVEIGNPPGKNKSIGDAINWVTLLESVPANQGLHIISEDGDFYSSINDELVHPFLQDEWSRIKGSNLNVYRTLSSFMNEHFDGVAFSFDKEKEELIENLNFSSNFATTHHLIEKLETYGYFSHKEIERILKAAISNNQLGWIITDYDISDFMNRVAVPKIDEIRNPDMKELLEKVMAEQQERKANSLSPNVNVEGVTKIDF